MMDNEYRFDPIENNSKKNIFFKIIVYFSLVFISIYIYTKFL